MEECVTDVKHLGTETRGKNVAFHSSHRKEKPVFLAFVPPRECVRFLF